MKLIFAFMIMMAIGMISTVSSQFDSRLSEGNESSQSDSGLSEETISEGNGGLSSSINVLQAIILTILCRILDNLLPNIPIIDQILCMNPVYF